MKNTLILLGLFLPFTLHANNFKQYIGADASVSIMDFTTDTDMDENFTNITINAGGKIGRNFGVELFYNHAIANDTTISTLYDELTTELGFVAYGFDIFGYYNLSSDFEFFTSFGVANYDFEITQEYTDYIYGTTTQITTDENRVSTRLGIGLMYTFSNQPVSLLAQYQYIPVNTNIINTISEFSIGFRYSF